MSTDARECEACHAAIPTDAGTLGLCPVCLIRRAITTGAANRKFELPRLEDVRVELSQLDVMELIGFGGMGVVYKARQRSLDRLVAVKVFPREMWEDDEFEKRFRREARLLASLSHPHIVTAYEYGESDAYYYLLMELVRGRSLRHVLKDGPLKLSETLDVATQVCDALEYAHRKGVVHQDIKPENILMQVGVGARTGSVQVADFGLAKLMGATEADGHRMGTPKYMAPEQRERPDEVDGRTDVFAMGVMLHEMLTGKLPDEPGSRPPEGRIGRVIRKCLETDPSQRYQRIPELKKDLEEARVSSGWTKWALAAGIAVLLLVAAIAIWKAYAHPPR